MRKRDIAKYVMLPGIFPRLRELFGSGFAHTAYFMATIYANVGLLPKDHAYLNPDNFGRFGVRHAVIEAARHIEWRWKNIDQIIIFLTILMGVFLLLLQLALGVMALLNPQVALAQEPGFQTWFGTESPIVMGTGEYSPLQDIAFIVLDQVFGVKGIFGSCVSELVPCTNTQGQEVITSTVYPYPMHVALHGLFGFYSYGLLFVGTIIILYFITTVVGETAVSGTPFGQRFNKAWAVPRLIVFFALLLPLPASSNLISGDQTSGLNGAQYITLWSAKFGSSFATNAWVNFNLNLSETYLGAKEELIASPNFPELGSALQFLFLAKVCQYAERQIRPNAPEIGMYVVRNPVIYGTPGYQEADYIDVATGAFPTYADLMRFYTGETSTGEPRGTASVIIRFGEHDPEEYPGHMGHVFPTCGEMRIPPGDMNEPGVLFIRDHNFMGLVSAWLGTGVFVDEPAQCHVRQQTTMPPGDECEDYDFESNMRQVIDNYIYFQRTSYQIGIDIQREQGNFAVPPELIAKGWAGAAIWFNRIAQMNGAITEAIMQAPRPHTYPDVMERVYTERITNNEQVVDPYNPDYFDQNLGSSTILPLSDDDEQLARIYYAAWQLWSPETSTATDDTRRTSNVFLNIINTLLGSEGIFDMRENYNIHPLAQLASIGKGLMEAGINNALIAGAGVVGQGFADAIQSGLLKQLASAISGTALTFLGITLVLGFILFYVLPFMPFIYFTFAISGWVKSIFEAMVGVPLWALAHIRIDGEGLPGQAASGGYFLLFEIFLRPIMILFGLLASIIIFSAQIYILHHTFDLVIANMTGHNNIELNESGNLNNVRDDSFENIDLYRGPLDEIMFTVVYVVLAFMAATSSFKLIDAIPNQIMRWAGFTTPTFQENAGDPASKVLQSSYQQTMLITNQLTGPGISGGKLQGLLL